MNRQLPAASEPGWDSGSWCDPRPARAARSASGAGTAAPARALNMADAGCGDGAQACLWAAQGHQVYGADSDAALVARARRRAAAAGLEIMFDHAGAGALPWPDRSMDVCIAPGAMHDWRGGSAELLRVLRPGGVLYIRATSAAWGPLKWFALLRLRRQLARDGLRCLGGAVAGASHTLLAVRKPAQ